MQVVPIREAVNIVLEGWNAHGTSVLRFLPLPFLPTCIYKSRSSQTQLEDLCHARPDSFRIARMSGLQDQSEHCEKCNKSFSCWDAFMIHKIESKKHICCLFCGRDFNTFEGCSRHQRQVGQHWCTLIATECSLILGSLCWTEPILCWLWREIQPSRRLYQPYWASNVSHNPP